MVDYLQFEVPTGLNTAGDYQPDAMIAFRYEGVWIGFALFNHIQPYALLRRSEQARGVHIYRG